MTIEKFVLDASVAAKWFLDEEFSVQAKMLLEKLLTAEIEFHAPVILQYELGHVLTKAQRKTMKRIGPDKAIEAYREFSSLPILFHEMDEDSRISALHFANRFRRGFYDSIYVCLAVQLGCKWLTSEERYGGEFPDGFPIDNVLPLQSLIER